MILIDGRPLQTYSKYRGIGRYTKSLIETFENYNQFFFLFFKNHDYNFNNSVNISSPKKLITFSDKFFLKKLLEDSNFIIYHSTGYALPKFPLKTKKILTIYDLTPLLFPNYFSYKHKFIFKMILKSGKYADKIICISESTKKDLLRFFPEYASKTKVIYPFIKSDFCYSKKSSDSIDKKYFLFVGGNDKIKNLDTILRAIKKTGLKLKIVGKFNDKEKKELLREHIRIQDKIVFTGFIDGERLKNLYKNAIALLYPSLNEGFGYPPLEALRCGTPSIVSKKGSLPEVLKENALYLDDPLDSDELADKMMKLSENISLREKIVERSEKLLSTYSQNSFEKKILSIYQELKAF